MRHKIEVCELEFDDDGNTLWVHSSVGATVLRIKCTGKVTVSRGCENIVPHSDMMVQGNIDICIPPGTDTTGEFISHLPNFAGKAEKGPVKL
jgi:hypothetical protein